MAKENLKNIQIATAYHPHGIKGEVEFRLLNENYEESVLDDGMRVFLFPASPKSKINKDGEEWIIKKIRFGNKVICSLEGMIDRTHLETLLPFEVYVPRDEFPENDDGKVYLVDLLEWDVVNEAKEKIGKIENFSDNGMQYLFNVRMLSGEVITLPYVDAFFPELDEETKQITMIMPEFTE